MEDEIEDEFEEDLEEEEDDNEIEFEEEAEEEEEIIEEKEVEEEEEEEESDLNELQFTTELGIELGKIKINVLKMLLERNIDIGKDEKEFLTMNSLDVFCKCIQNKKNYFNCEYQWNNKSLLTTFIIHNDKKKVCLNEIKDIFKKKYNYYILIIPDKLSFDANIEIQKNKNVEIFSYSFFHFSIVDHAYVPKHMILTLKETEDFLKARNIKLEQLPIIRASDPVVKYYGWKKNSIVKIKRPSGNFYRVII